MLVGLSFARKLRTEFIVSVLPATYLPLNGNCMTPLSMLLNLKYCRCGISELYVSGLNSCGVVIMVYCIF